MTYSWRYRSGRVLDFFPSHSRNNSQSTLQIVCVGRMSRRTIVTNNKEPIQTAAVTQKVEQHEYIPLRADTILVHSNDMGWSPIWYFPLGFPHVETVRPSPRDYTYDRVNIFWSPVSRSSTHPFIFATVYDTPHSCFESGRRGSHMKALESGHILVFKGVQFLATGSATFHREPGFIMTNRGFSKIPRWHQKPTQLASSWKNAERDLEGEENTKLHGERSLGKREYRKSYGSETVQCRGDGCESCIGIACTQLLRKGRYFGRVDTANENKG